MMGVQLKTKLKCHLWVKLCQSQACLKRCRSLKSNVCEEKASKIWQEIQFDWKIIWIKQLFEII